MHEYKHFHQIHIFYFKWMGPVCHKVTKTHCDHPTSLYLLRWLALVTFVYFIYWTTTFELDCQHIGADFEPKGFITEDKNITLYKGRHYLH